MPDQRADSVSGAPASQQVDVNPQTGPAPQQLDPNASYIVDGQVVSGQDVLNQRLMHADYTRKTQALSGERSKYEAATQLLTYLESDPDNAIAELAQYYGRRAPTGGNEPSPNEYVEEQEQADPRLAALEQRQAELSDFAEEQLQRQADEFLETQMGKVADLAGKLGLPVDTEELFQYAFANNFVDPLAAFLRMHADDLPDAASKKAISDYTSRRGLPVNRGSLRAPQAGERQRPRAKSIREALAYAIEDEGVADIRDLPLE